MANKKGGLAQLVPKAFGTLPWHGRGHRFESVILHKSRLQKGEIFCLCFSYTSFTRKRLIATISDQQITSKKGWSPTLPAFRSIRLLRMIGWSFTRRLLQPGKKH